MGLAAIEKGDEPVDAQHPLAVVTPTLDGDVLGVLALADEAFTTGQLHRTLSRFSEDGIRKALARLRKQGIVVSEPAGNAYLYRFNRDHLAAEPIRALARLRETLLARIEECLESWKRPPLYAAVFGSMARATAGTTSDIDLLLVKDDDVPDELWDAQLAKLADDISKWTGNDARPVTFSASELARRRGEPLFAEVLADGLTVCGQRSWLQRQIGQA
ncbi:MAG: nucleotidyltransferase domain-containing protein [Acidimicrobiales bacterium]